MPFINSKISTSITASQEESEICKIFDEVLGISPDHVYVKYEAVSNWGWNGGNF